MALGGGDSVNSASAPPVAPAGSQLISFGNAPWLPRGSSFQTSPYGNFDPVAYLAALHQAAAPAASSAPAPQPAVALMAPSTQGMSEGGGGHDAAGGAGDGGSGDGGGTSGGDGSGSGGDASGGTGGYSHGGVVTKGGLVGRSPNAQDNGVAPVQIGEGVLNRGAMGLLGPQVFAALNALGSHRGLLG